MKLILKKSVENLGEAGEVIQVKPGFGRNYLIPQGLAYIATQANIQRLEQEQAQSEERSKREELGRHGSGENLGLGCFTRARRGSRA